MKSYTSVFIAGMFFSSHIFANAFLHAGNRFAKAARIGIQSFRSEMASGNQSAAQAQEVSAQSQAQVVNLKTQQNIAQVLDVLTKEKDRPVTINIIDAKHNKGNIGSTFVKAASSTKRTEQKFDHSFNQETKNNASSNKYHEGHLIGVSAATLAIVEFVHYVAK